MNSLAAKKVAVIGGGFAGLGIAYRCAEKGCLLDIYDPRPVGQADGSSAAAGLMYPLTKKGVMIWKGLESYKSALQLFSDVEKKSSKKFVLDQMNLLRLSKEDEKTFWLKAMKERPEWVHKLESDIPTLLEDRKDVFLIKNPVILNSKAYLLALWLAVVNHSKRANWIHSPVEKIEDLFRSYDIVIIAAGGGSPFLWTDDPSHRLQAKHVAGSNIFYKNSIGLKDALISGHYMVPHQDADGSSTIMVGATHDHVKITPESYWDQSYSQEMDHYDKIFRPTLLNNIPQFGEISPLRIQSGVRLATKRTDLGRPPIVGKHPFYNNCWVFTGLGSHGILYHSWLSENLLRAIEADDEKYLPSEVLPKCHYPPH